MGRMMRQAPPVAAVWRERCGRFGLAIVLAGTPRSALSAAEQSSSGGDLNGRQRLGLNDCGRRGGASTSAAFLTPRAAIPRLGGTGDSSSSLPAQARA